MAGDYIEPIEIRQGTSYIENAVSLAVEHQCAPQEAIDRLSKLIACIHYVHAEGAVWRGFIGAMDHARSGHQWHKENVAHLYSLTIAALAGPPPPKVLPEVERLAVQTLLGQLIDNYSAGEVAVMMDAALEQRRP